MLAGSAQPTRRVIIATDWASGSPRLRVRDDDETESRLIEARGVHLAYHASPDSPRQCLGHTPFRDRTAGYVDCTKRPAVGSRTCEQCSIVAATLASNLHHAHTRGRSELDPAIVEQLRQPNQLYVAAFRDGSLKVGTSAKVRRDKRLAEQGAWRAAIVADADDGFAVRVIEDRVTAELGLPQSVSIGRKLDGMATPRPDHVLDDSLAEATADVHALLETADDARLRPRDERWLFPSATAEVWTGLHPYPLKPESGNHDVEIVDMCGRMAALRRTGTADVFIADLGRLFGVELALGDVEADELAVQDALF